MFIRKAREESHYKDQKLSLLKVCNINFTSREVDIIACQVNGRTASDEIASFLSIESKTVESHKNNYKNKLGGRNIRDLIEKSSERDVIKSYLNKHYSYILSQDHHFKQKLHSIKNKTTPLNIKIYYYKDSESEYLMGDKKRGGHGKLVKQLLFMQCNVEICNIADIKSYSDEVQHEDADFVILISSEVFIKFVDSRSLSKDEEREHIRLSSHISLLKDKSKIINLLQTDIDDEHPLLKHTTVIDFQKNYHHTFLELLKTLMPHLGGETEKFVSEFKKRYSDSLIANISSDDTVNLPTLPYEDLQQGNRGSFKSISLLYIKNHRLRIISVCFVVMFILLIHTSILLNPLRAISSHTEHHHYISSELIVPADNILLNRDSLIHEIDNLLQGDEDIQTVALVGVGGAGKTTLARKYAQGSWASVIWEVNAESIETIRCSFENLAHALAKTEEDQKNMQYIQKIPDVEQRYVGIMTFVKDKLRANPNWLLIYDNLDNLAEFQKSFLIDSSLHGKGKIIITTRDANIHNNSHIRVVDIGALDESQKLRLFLKIMYDEQSVSVDKTQLSEITKFLEIIPPFPLDISTAAYYLKDTQTSFTRYIDNLGQNNQNFNNVQSALLHETGDYTNTRYSIIKVSLEHLMQTDKDFADLMLFICLLDSQNIPRAFLDAYKNTALVDDFLHNLKKYSFITHESISHLGQAFSMHRSTQNVALAYLIKNLNPKATESIINFTIGVIDNNIDDAIDKEDIEMMKILLSHSETLLNRAEILNAEKRAMIESKLGCVYYYLGNGTRASLLLTRSAEILNKNYNSNYEAIAQNLIYLGLMYSSLEDMHNAEDCFRRSLKIYNEKFTETHRNIPKIIIYLGRYEQELGNYKVAKQLFEQGLLMYQKHHASNHARIAWALTYLGNIDRKLGDYERAKNSLEKGLDIYTQYCPNQRNKIAVTLTALGKVYRDMGDFEAAIHWIRKGADIAAQEFGEINQWHLVYLANTYARMRNYKEAIVILEKSLSIYKKYAPQNYVDWVSIYLGSAYASTGHYDKAKELLEPSRASYKHIFGKESVKMAWVLSQLGHLYTYLPDHERAQEDLEQGLVINERILPQNHMKIGYINRFLGDNYMLQGDCVKAKEHLARALTIYQKTFPASHVLIARITTSIGYNEMLLGNIDNSEEILNASLNVFRKNVGNSDIFMPLEGLGDLNARKIQLLSETDSSKRKELRAQAIAYLNEALNVIVEHFPDPKHSAHYLRVKEKLERV